MPSDSLRRLLCLILPVVQIVTAALPYLGIGHSVAVMSASSQTPVIPAGYAFPLMWGLLFLLSLAFGVWQALPAQHADPAAQRVGWPLAGVFAANTLWQLAAQFSRSNGFGLVLVILIALACALAAFFLARRGPVLGGMARWLVYPLTGLMAGWLTAATFANISGAARAAGMIPDGGFGASMAAVLILLAAGGFAAAMAWASRGSRWYLGGVGWALVAVVVANLGANQFDIMAAIVAAAMLALVAAVSWQRRRAESVALA
ncbi:hypothetical protein LPC08_08575 [Roseomonas sp. OT10]|uniref:hypothetical protein n=1 Tax=Roseomonas cutis TaxID=2897332 RepID=UPI001E533263|nr:hypothetical protein [Roseomonas sp. OT10]UFN50653.1 hypothetical protein LPC08_08575 [Roseomonas sp. OT10]